MQEYSPRLVFYVTIGRRRYDGWVPIRGVRLRLFVAPIRDPFRTCASMARLSSGSAAPSPCVCLAVPPGEPVLVEVSSGAGSLVQPTHTSWVNIGQWIIKVRNGSNLISARFSKGNGGVHKWSYHVAAM